MTENVHKYSVTKAVFRPLLQFSDNLGVFAAVGGFFAVLLLLLAYLFGQTYVCIFRLETVSNIFCQSGSGNVYFPYFFCKIAVITGFITIWYDKVFLKAKTDRLYLHGFWKKYLRNFAVLVVFIVLNCIPVISAFLLLFRVPNPVWQIELMYFTVVAAGFLVPFILMRFYAVFAQLLAGGGLRNIKQIWLAAQGNGLKVVMSVSALFIINMILLMGTYSFLRRNIISPLVIYNLLAEFVYDIFTLLMIGLTVNFMQMQKEILNDGQQA